jgi:DNA polymerase-3 subunit delta'
VIFERIAPEQHDTLPEIPEPPENPLLFGHGEAADLLASAYRAGKLHHGLLLAGPQGIGKATLAFHLARHILKHPVPADAPETLVAPDPAGSLFRMIAQGAHPGVLHLTRPLNKDGKSFRTVITVDEVRRVSRFLSMTAHDGGYRIVIIDPADDMNTSAANALLKNLEEPPARSLFILISHQLGRLLPTIRSRCQIIKLAPLPNEALRAILGRLDAEGSQDEALAERAAGSARNAILLTQYGGLKIAEVVDRLLTGGTLDVAEAHKLGDAVSGREQAIQFGIFNRHLLDTLAAVAGAAARAGEIAEAERFSRLWQETSGAIMDTETYNLDKKQHVLGLLHKLHAAMNRRPSHAAG